MATEAGKADRLAGAYITKSNLFLLNETSRIQIHLNLREKRDCGRINKRKCKDIKSNTG